MRKHRPFVDTLRPLVFGLLLISVVCLLLAFRLNTLLPGYSPAEVATYQEVQSMTVQSLAEDSLFFAYKLGAFALQQLGLLSLFALRLVSAVFGLIGALAFYLLLRKWHTQRIALMGGLLFVTASWFLQTSRVATPQSMYLLMPLLLYLGVKLEEGTQRLSVAVLSVLVVTQLFYLPGMVWLLLGGLIWQRKRLLIWLGEIHTAAVAFLYLFGIALMVPLGYSLVTNPDFWMVWLAYPLQDQTLIQFARNLVTVPWHVFFKHITAPEFHVGRLPLLDIATSAFFFLGIYWYFFQRKLDRSKIILGGLVFGCFLIAAVGLAAQAFLLPFIYILVAGGITLMLQQWFTVFPRNPLARGVGLGFIIAIVGLISFYQLRRYFVAWPNAPETKQIYSIPSDTI